MSSCLHSNDKRGTGLTTGWAAGGQKPESLWTFPGQGQSAACLLWLRSRNRLSYGTDKGLEAQRNTVAWVMETDTWKRWARRQGHLPRCTTHHIFRTGREVGPGPGWRCLSLHGIVNTRQKSFLLHVETKPEKYYIKWQKWDTRFCMCLCVYILTA